MCESGLVPSPPAEARGLRGIFGQLERGGLIDVLIRAVHESPDAFEGGLEVVASVDPFGGDRVGDGCYAEAFGARFES